MLHSYTIKLYGICVVLWMKCNVMRSKQINNTVGSREFHNHIDTLQDFPSQFTERHIFCKHWLYIWKVTACMIVRADAIFVLIDLLNLYFGSGKEVSRLSWNNNNVTDAYHWHTHHFRMFCVPSDLEVLYCMSSIPCIFM